MDQRTRRALVAVNRRFYARHSAGFSASRERPWCGWDRLLRRLEPAAGEPLRVLDVGCGNGRFASYLARRHRGKIRYHGVDGSPELLAVARRRLTELEADGVVEVRLAELDVTCADERGSLGGSGGGYDLIALFGVLHHVPGRDVRRGLLAWLAPWVARGGLLAASLWRFDQQPRFAAKTLLWEEFNRDVSEPVDLEELERGDHLLTWDGDRETPRYCHLVDNAEAGELIRSASLPLIDRFSADGPGNDRNLYLVFQRPRRPPAA